MGNVIEGLSLTALIANGAVAVIHAAGHMPYKRPSAANAPPAPDYFAWASYLLARVLHVLVWLSVYTGQGREVRSDGTFDWAPAVGLSAAFAFDWLAVSQLLGGNGFSAVAGVFFSLLGALAFYLGRSLTLNDAIGHYVVGGVLLIFMPSFLQLVVSGLAGVKRLLIGYSLVAAVVLVGLVGLDMIDASVFSANLTIGLWFGYSILITLVTLLLCFLGIKWHWLKSVFYTAAATVKGTY